MKLDLLIESIAPGRDYVWAFEHFKTSLLRIAAGLPNPSVLEIGGGRSPLFTQQEIDTNFSAYTVNDISRSELDRGPDYVQKTCFDISGDLTANGTYDLIFSRMVFEHIKDGPRAYRNVYTLLNPEGVAINFVPTLMSPPFVVNRLLPETVSRKVLEFFFPERNEDESPKFPAYYSWCYSNPKTIQRIKDVGFSDATATPFYGHGYFQKIPVLRQLDATLSRFADSNDIRLLSSYAYLLMQK